MSPSRRGEAHPPLYARLLRLRNVAPSGLLCFIFLEGTVALGALLALAELVSWWGVLVLPLTVAVMVKLNDVVAGALSRPSAPAGPGAPAAARAEVLRPATAGGPAPAMRMAEEATTRLPGVINRERGAPIMRPWAEEVEAQQWRVRQSATRRYE
ncbi:hypothetical protein [Paractinoplanes globisporus]|uniref:Uncharacterized protein n=1 Tax=Paractinoplanes globisporus TaxID=113565 RepID=A0ABW6WK73_9ACTN|nr:hypothetical protein [Actinoplanes globisporus]